MTSKTLLLIGCAGLLAAPAAATAQGGMTTICHRTGAPARTPGLFQGQIIKVANQSLAMHVPGHGDVVIPQSLVSRFNGRTCQTDGYGGLYDANGQPVQTVSGGGGSSGGGSSGGWGGGGGTSGG